MKRKLLSIALVLAMLVSWIPVSAADTGNVSWFSDQLTAQGKDIYHALVQWFQDGGMVNGTEDYDLVAQGVVTEAVVENYLSGNRTLFNDFAAAKDAFDLEHPEAWYLDSSYLSFRVTQGTDGALHAYMGTGRGENYYVAGVRDAADVAAKDAALRDAVQVIVENAGKQATDAEKVRYVHKQITTSISYRFENTCAEENVGYLRTAYALVTHEGVCEGYARSFQWVMRELGIPCVLIHGVQTSGTPEEHMWTAVQLDGQWYVVDPTWDDPIPLDKDGNIKQGTAGLDGGETETYLLVGRDIVGENWVPSGYVSTGTMEFRYPTIALSSYNSSTLEKDGLKIDQSESTMETVAATKYEVSFKGMGVEQAAEAGYYFLVKMYDLNADGSVDAFEDWYYPAHMLQYYAWDHSENPYFYDSAAAMTMIVAQAEYIEFAITTTAPPDWQVPDDLVELGGYYSGNGADILAESGLLCNIHGGYEAPPYVKNVSPTFNSSLDVGVDYTIHLEFTDPLYRPAQSDLDNAISGKEGDLQTALKEDVSLDFVGTTYAWGVQARQPHTFADRPEPTNILVYCDTHKVWHSGLDTVTHDCTLSALEYNFTASKMWADDSIQYEFSLSGLVGRKSNKYLNTWSYVFENPSIACAYRCSAGIDWNLWGQPQLLDNPNDLDLSKMVTQGVTAEDASNLAALRDSMHLDDQDMNGRLVLVAENLSSSRSSTEELSNALDVNNDAILGSSMYEIDFARICQKTVVKTGQSLRMSIGFPAGYDASMAGVTFKAYHFTRNDDGEIISVEELPITVTPYGLIVLCSSFSPFEIVALDGSKVPDTSAKYTVTLVNDGYGTITSGGEAVTMVEIPETGAVTFDVKPIEGYELDTISFSGQGEITVQNNQFTLSRADLAGAANGNAIVSVTFVAVSVHETDAENGETVLTPAVCNHENTTGTDYLAATCTTDGHTAGKTCTDCGQVLSVSETIPATGHTYLDGKCTRCGAEISDHVCAGDTFTDLDLKRWYHSYVDYVVAHGLMHGTSATTFSPDDTTTRAMVAQILYEAEGKPAVKQPAPFTDLETGRWYVTAVAWAAEQELMVGAQGLFRPNDPVTREELAAILRRYANYRGTDVTVDLADITEAQDFKSVSTWARADMAWAVGNGILSGTSLEDLVLYPRESALRTHVAKMVADLFQKVLKTDP